MAPPRSVQVGPRPRSRGFCRPSRTLLLPLLLAAAVVLLAQPTWGRVAVDFATPYTGLPGQCTTDIECALGRTCTAEGACQDITSGRMYTRLLTNKTVVPVAIFGGIFMLLLVSLGGFAITPQARCRLNPNDASVHLMILWCFTGQMCCIGVGMALGLTLGLWRVDVTPKFMGTGAACSAPGALVCGAYYCDMRVNQCFTRCTRDGQCVSGAECYNNVCYTNHRKADFDGKQPKFKPGIAAVAAIFSALGACLVCGFLAICCYIGDDFNDSYDWTSCLKAMTCVCTIGVGLAVGLSMGLARNSSQPLSGPPANATVCAADRTCAPYLCNPRSGVCTYFCRQSSDCFDSFSCEAGACVRGNVGLDHRVVSIGGVIAATVVIGVCLVVAFATVCGIINPFGFFRYDSAQRMFCVTIFSVIILAVWILVFGVPLGLGKQITPFKSVGAGAPCVDQRAVVCSPYLCDVRSSRCQETCSDSYECASGTKCDGGKCVLDMTRNPDKTNGARGPRLPPLAVVGIALASPLPLIFMLFLCQKLYSRYDDELGHPEYDLGSMGRAAMPCVCITVILILGAVLGGFQPRWPRSAGTPLLPNAYPMWAFVTFTVAGACGLCFLAMVISRLSMRLNFRTPVGALLNSGRDSAQFAGAFCTLILTFLVGIFICGLGFGLWRGYIPMPRASAVNGTTCVGTWDARCWPFSCDTGIGYCRTACTRDVECGTGNGCRGGVCTPAIPALPLGKRQGVVTIVGCTLGAFALCFAFIVGTAGWRRRPNFLSGFNRMRAPLVVCSACCCGVMVATLVGVPLSLKTHNAGVPQPVGLGAVCNVIDALQCAPYFCDVAGGRCFTACRTSEHCTDEAHPCVGGRCVSKTPIVLFASAWGVGAAALLIILCSIIGPRILGAVEAIRRRRALALAEEQRRRTAAFREQQARIVKLQLNVEPAPETTKDPTLPTPYARGPGAFNFDDPEAAGGVGMVPVAAADGAEPELCAVCFFNPAAVRLAIKPDGGASCGHLFCEACARDSLQMMVDTAQFPARCPGCRANETVEAPDTPEHIRSLIPSGLIERLARRAVVAIDFARRFINLQLMKALNPDELVMCPSCDLLSCKPATAGKKGKDRTKATCTNCATDYCCECLAFWYEHAGYDCTALAKAKASGNDAATMEYIMGSSKPCPNCGAPITHYKNHACHHIAPGTGCPSCGTHFCYVCLKGYPCGLDGHSLFCDDSCDCPQCPTCYPGHPCPHCSGDCPSCQGRPMPGANAPNGPPGAAPPRGDFGGDFDNGNDGWDNEPVFVPPPPQFRLQPAPPRMRPPPPQFDDDVNDLLAGMDVPADFWEPVVQAGPADAGGGGFVPARAQPPGLNFLQQIQNRGMAPPIPPPLPNPNWRIENRAVRDQVRRVYHRDANIRAVLVDVVAAAEARHQAMLGNPDLAPDTDRLPPPLPPPATQPQMMPPPPSGQNAVLLVSAPTPAGGSAADAGAFRDDGVTVLDDGAAPNRAGNNLRVTLPASRGPSGPATGDSARSADSSGPPPLSPGASPLYARRGLGSKTLTLAPAGGDDAGAGPAAAAAAATNIFDLQAYPQTARETAGRLNFEQTLAAAGGPGSARGPAVVPNKRFSAGASVFHHAPLPATSQTPTGTASGAAFVVDRTEPSRLVPRTPMSAHPERLRQFVELTGVDEKTARNYLGLFNWDVQQAFQYFDDTTNRRIASAGPSSARRATPGASGESVRLVTPVGHGGSGAGPAFAAAAEPVITVPAPVAPVAATPAASTPVAASVPSTASAASTPAGASSTDSASASAASLASTPAGGATAPPLHPISERDSSASTVSSTSSSSSS